MGIEVAAVVLSAVVSAIAGGTWVGSKILERTQERVRNLHEDLEVEKAKIEALDHRIDQMPVTYVLRQDFVREMDEMRANFKIIHSKLDRLLEMLLSK